MRNLEHIIRFSGADRIVKHQPLGQDKAPTNERRV